MPNRRFEMYQYRHILVRMRMGDSNRAIADSGIAGRNKVKAIKRIASKHGWLEPDSERSLRPNLQFCCRKWSVGIKSYLLVSLKRALMVLVLENII